MATKQEKQAVSERARKTLLDPEWGVIKRGATLYTSWHGTGTSIKVYVIQQDDDQAPIIRNITALIADLIQYPKQRKGGDTYVRNTVVGMDRGFDVVYTASSILFNDGYALNHQWL